MTETRVCPISQQSFVITEEDLLMYQKLGVPSPTLSPLLRLVRRMAFRNERKIYQRKCDVTGKNIISAFSVDSPHKVCEGKVWYSDQFDVTEYGRDYDFSRPFFEQFHEFLLDIPLPSLRVEGSENCDFNSDTSRSKDCYLCSRTHESEKSLYSYRCNKSRECVDCRQVVAGCELLYECTGCINCYDSQFLESCDRCSNSYYLTHCRGCMDCFLCSDLDKARFHFLNESLSEEDYKAKVASFALGSRKVREDLLAQFEDLKSKRPAGGDGIGNSEHCTGGNIWSCKDCHQCYDTQEVQDGRYLFNVMKSNDLMDCYSGKEMQLAYECTSCTRSYNVQFGVRLPDTRDSQYGMYCSKGEYLLGCIGIQGGKHMILNKAYTQQEYDTLHARIKAHMQETGEWGEFFPISISPFAYNETVAHEYFPVTKDFCLGQGWRWKEDDPKEYQPSTYMIPDHITDVEDAITSEVLACGKTGKNYRITPQELQYYRRQQIPVPVLGPDARYDRRFTLQDIPFS